MHPKALRYASDPEATAAYVRDNDVTQDMDFARMQERLEHHHISALVQGTTEYHYKFHTITAAPYIVFAMGDLSLLNRPILAIVGPRRMSSYAEQVVSNTLQASQHYDVVTISGLADGVDMLTHSLSLEYTIPTIVVLGAGLAHYLSSSKRSFLEKIVHAGGLILSDYKPKQAPMKYTFPQRNRLIAGLAECVLVPEAGIKSGSLITVDYATTMHKPVYGTPNSIFAASSAGLHQYMAQGKVQVIHTITDFLAAHFHTHSNQDQVPPIALDPEQQALYDHFAQQAERSLTQLTQHTNLPITTLTSMLTMLELAGLIYQVSPTIYQRCQKLAK